MSYSPWGCKESDTTQQLSTAQVPGLVRGQIQMYMKSHIWVPGQWVQVTCLHPGFKGDWETLLLVSFLGTWDLEGKKFSRHMKYDQEVPTGMFSAPIKHWNVYVQLLSHVWLFATPWTVAHQAPLSMDSPGNNTAVGCHFLLQALETCSQVCFVFQDWVQPEPLSSVPYVLTGPP